MSLIIDTELIRYKWVSVEGNYPDWEKLIPTEHKLTAHLVPLSLTTYTQVAIFGSLEPNPAPLISPEWGLHSCPIREVCSIRAASYQAPPHDLWLDLQA